VPEAYEDFFGSGAAENGGAEGMWWIWEGPFGKGSWSGPFLRFF